MGTSRRRISPREGSHALFAAVVAFMLLAAVGCARSDDPPVSSTPTLVSPSTMASATASADSQREAGQVALAAYRGMWAAFVEAGRTSDPDAPDVRKYASDNALKLIVNALYVNRDQKQIALGEVVLDPRVTAVKPESDPTEVTILDCVNDEKWLEYNVSGGLVNDVPGGKHHTTATVTRNAEGWKVSAFTLKDVATC